MFSLELLLMPNRENNRTTKKTIRKNINSLGALAGGRDWHAFEREHYQSHLSVPSKQTGVCEGLDSVFSESHRNVRFLVDIFLL